MTEVRHRIWQFKMEQAEANPEIYSRIVTLPTQDEETLINRKIEFRMSMEEDVVVTGEDGKAVIGENGEEETTTSTYLHCFEGTITTVHAPPSANGKVRLVKGTGVRTKWAVVTISWDVEFLAFGDQSNHALDPGLYAKENKEHGWNVPNQEYILAVQSAVDKFAELREQYGKDKAAPDADMFMTLLLADEGRSEDDE